MMLSAATSTTSERITNITRRSTSSASRNAPEASRQVQTSARGPAASAIAGTKRSTSPGFSTMTSISSATSSRLK